MRDRMPEPFLQIADDEEPDAELIADANNIAVDLGGERKLQQNDLGDATLAVYFLQIAGVAQNRNSVFGLVDFFIANQTDSAQPNFCFASYQVAQLVRRAPRPYLYRYVRT